MSNFLLYPYINKKKHKIMGWREKRRHKQEVDIHGSNILNVLTWLLRTQKPL